MPSTIHQGLSWAFADDPPLAFELMRDLFDVPVPALESITDRRTELDRYAPCFGDTNELRPDVALSADLAKPSRTGKFAGGMGLVIEVLRKPKQAKRWRMRVYQALMAERLRRATGVMLVTVDDRVAKWARGLDALEIRPRDSLMVLDRQNMPRITDLDFARQQPSKALLSALLHSTTDDFQVLQPAFAASRELPDDRRWRYGSAILAAVNKEREAQLLASVTMDERYELTRMERNSIAWHDGHDEGLLEGKQAGLLEGKREALIATLLTLLELRSLAVDAASEQRIRSCTDPELLQRWIARAVQASAVSELF